MANSRQKTLFESWSKNPGYDPVCYKMKIVLSSEREDVTDNVSPKVQGGNFTKPGKPARRAVQRKQLTKDENKSTKSMKIDEAFKHAATKTAFTSLPFNTTMDQVSEISVKDPKISTAIAEREMDIDHFFIENSEQDMDDHRFLCDLFDIRDKVNCASCIFIPSPPKIIKPIKRSATQLTDAERDALLLDKSELQCLLENIETISLAGSRDGKCICGNINTTCLDLCNGDFKSFSPDECHNKTTNDLKNNNTYSKSTQSGVSLKTEIRSSFSCQNIKSSATNNRNSGTTKVEVDVDTDAVFAFEEDDSFFNDEDDWLDKVNEKYEVDVKEERNRSKSPIITRFKISSIENHKFDSPKTFEVASSKLDYTSPTLISNQKCRLDIPVIFNNSEEPDVCFTNTEMANIFADEILFGDDSDCESNIGDIKSYTTIQIKTEVDLYKSEQSEDNKIHKAPHADELNDSSTASSGMFSPFQNNEQDQIFSFIPEACVQSTPKKVFCTDHFSQPLLDIEDVSNHSDDLFPTSPDLSQYRLQNQMKRAKYDCENLCPISNTYATMTAPDNDSANMLNRYVEEMRQKHSNSPALDIAQRKEFVRKSSESNEIAPLNDCKSKKKFVFKKRPITKFPEPEVTIAAPVRNIESKTVVTSNTLLPSPNTFKEYRNEPRKFVGISKNIKVTSNGDEFDKNPISLPIEKSNHNSRFNFERFNFQSNGMENIKDDVLHYKMQYCSEDMMDTTDLDDLLHESKERTRLKEIQEQNLRRELTEQKRLQAIQLRNSKMKKSQEVSSLKSLSIIHPIKQEKVEELQLMTLTKNNASQKIKQENIDEIRPMKQEHLQTVMTAPKSTNYQKRHYEHIKIATPSVSQTNSNKIENNKSNSKVSRKTSNSVQRSPSIQRNQKPFSTTPSTTGFSDDDDDFVFVRPKPRLLNATFQSPQNLSEQLSLREKEVIATSSQYPQCQEKRNVRRKLPRNPFVEYEAEVIEDSSDDADDDDLEELDTFDDSFVTHEMDDPITYTQQARYAESTKDLMPVPFSRIERERIPTTFDPLNSYSEYERDSFCVDNDDINFSEVGVFTQAMNNAKSELEKEGDNSNGKRQTRRAERLKKINAAWLDDNNNNKIGNGDKKKRRRVFLLDDED